MIVDEYSPPASQIDLIGWPWHGRLESRVAEPPVRRLVMEGRTINHGDPVSANSDDGTWTIAEPLSGDTFLWAPPGLVDVPDEAIEEQGGAWWGRAILRQPGCYAYGGLQVARVSSDNHRAAWPVWFDGVKGQVSVRLQTDTGREIRICPDDTLGLEETVVYTVALDDIDLQQGGPDVYINGSLADRAAIGRLLDITSDGLSALFAVEASSSAPSAGGLVMTTGLVRLDITPTVDAYTAALTVLVNRADAVGTLSSTDSGSLTFAGLVPAPIETVQSGGVPPSCGQTILRAEGELVDAGSAPGASHRGLDGSQTRVVSRTGALIGAWFGAGGAVEEVRFDLQITEALSNSRRDDSTGSYEQVTAFTFDGSQCQLTGTTTTDTRAINLHGELDYSLEYRMRLYGPAGLVDERVHEYRAHTDCDVGAATGGDLVGTHERWFYADGVVIAHDVSDSLPNTAWGLPQGAATIFGGQVTQPDLSHSYFTEVPTTGAGGLAVQAQLGVLIGSNHAYMLAALQQVASAGWEISSGPVVTPTGTVDEPLTSDITFTGSAELRQGNALAFQIASHNPVTGQLARAWPDLTNVNWC